MDYHQAKWSTEEGKLEPLIFERGVGKNDDYSFDSDSLSNLGLPESLLREDLDIPDLTEPEVVRHFTRLSQMNYGIDSGIYP